MYFHQIQGAIGDEDEVDDSPPDSMCDGWYVRVARRLIDKEALPKWFLLVRLGRRQEQW